MLNESIHFSKLVARNNANCHYYSKQIANIQSNMFRNKEAVFYLFFVMVVCEFSYSGLVCCGFFSFSFFLPYW